MIAFTDSADVALILAVDAERTAREAERLAPAEPDPAEETEDTEPSPPRRARRGNRRRRADLAADLAGAWQLPPPRLEPEHLRLMLLVEAERADRVRRAEAARAEADRAERERAGVDAFLAEYGPPRT